MIAATHRVLAELRATPVCPRDADRAAIVILTGREQKRRVRLAQEAEWLRAQAARALRLSRALAGDEASGALLVLSLGYVERLRAVEQELL